MIKSKKNPTIVQMYEECVEERMNEVAIEIDEETITYGTLQKNINYYAKLLRQAGVKPQEVVAIISERSIEMIISIMAVLKIGAIYLPIEPSLPKERIEFMLSDSKVKNCMLGKGRNLEDFSNYKNITCFNVARHDTYTEKIDAEQISGEMIAYIIYTSGTTGKPKGTMIKHESLTNLVNWERDFLEVDMFTKVIQQFSSIFDGSVFEMFVALSSGAKLVIVTNEKKQNLSSFIDLLPNSILVTIPSLFEEILTYAKAIGEEHKISNMKKVCLAGEPTTPKIVKGFYSVVGEGNCKLYNFYGPTEATVCATAYEVKNTDYSIVPIGKPISNVNAYIVNNNQLCDVGEEGELCLSGISITTGYLNRDDLTNEKIVRLSCCENNLVYKTGDLVKENQDGEILFLGRIDEQVKIRGFRIELSEIENQLTQYDEISEGKVVVQEIEGNKYICAYYIAKRILNEDKIRQGLLKKLPAYMIPSYFFRVEKFYSTHNGKLDKSKLPLPHYDNEIGSEKIMGEKEDVIAEVFGKILGYKNIDKNSEFFELGGDSIKALRMVTELRKMGYITTVKQVMQDKNVKNISKNLEEKISISTNTNVTGEVKLSPIQKRFLFSNLAEPNHFNQSFLFYSKEVLNYQVLENVVKNIVQSHDLLRSKYVENQQIISKVDDSDKFYELHFVDVADKNHEEMLEYIKKVNYEYQIAIDIGQGPIIKGILFNSKEESFFLLCIHHLVVDGISWRIIADDLNDLYEAYSNGNYSMHIDKTMSFKNWTDLLHEYSKTNFLQKEKQYWNRIVDNVALNNLEIEKATVPMIEHYKFNFTQSFSQDLIFRALKAYNTEISDLLLTAMLLAIKDITQKRGSCVFFERHGRENIFNDESLDRTVGWFTCLHPLVISDFKETIGENICQVKESIRRVPNKGIGYSVLQAFDDECNNWEEPQVTFNYLGEFNQNTNEGNIEIHDAEYGNQVSNKNLFGSEIIFDGMIDNGCLSFSVLYNASVCSRKLISDICDSFQNNLQQTVKHCLSTNMQINTCSDFGEREWEQNDLEKALGKYNIEKIYPLTTMQKGILYHKQLKENSTQYFIQSLFKTKTQINIDTFSKCLSLVEQKHELLRSAVYYRDIETPRVIVIKNRKIECKVTVISENDNYTECIDRIMKEDLEQGFDLENDVLLRFNIINIKGENSLLLMSFHHIIMDGWCESLLMNDISRFYNIIDDKQEIRIENTFDYSNYIHKITNEDFSKEAQYFTDILEDDTYDRGINGDKELDEGSEVGTISTEIPDSVVKKIRAVSESNNITVSTIMETVWGITLQKYNYSDDVVYGRVVSGRNIDFEGIEKAVGLFINTIPVRLTTQKNQKIKDILQGCQEKSFTDQLMENCPLTVIEEKGHMMDVPFNTIFAYGNYLHECDSDSIFTNKICAREQTNYSLTVSITFEEKMECEILYNAQQYSEEFVKEILMRYMMILNKILEYPEIEIGSIPLSTEQECNLIKSLNSEIRKRNTVEKGIVDLFVEVAKKNPDKIAIETEKEQLTYKQLDEFSDYIACQLNKKGIRSEELVAIESVRNVEFVIGILGIIKAGAAYLPISEDEAVQRKEFILEDSSIRFVLVQSKKKEYEKYEQILLKKKKLDKNNEFLVRPNYKVNKLAYSIYTSGTTGEPKGVLVTQENIINLVINNNYVSFNNIRILQTGALSFDASTFEIWGALLNEGYVFLSDKDTLLDVEKVKTITKEKKINTAFLTTALFNYLVSEDVNCFATLSQLLFGGEAASVEHVNKLISQNLKLKVSNIYGPTETTTFALFYPINNMHEKRVPIGRPILGVQAYVINNGIMCGLNMPGELCIGGKGVSKGYLNREDITNEKFFLCNIGDKNPTLLYKTGDLVKWNSNGDIEYLGRLDQQVKIRGLRIELDEIKYAIGKVINAKDIFVSVMDIEGEKRIIAYYVSDKEIDIKKVINELGKLIPHYMIPNYFEKIQLLPYTKNGKVDVKKLPKPNYKFIKEIKHPKNQIEKQILSMFREILNMNEISIDDDFFEIGGHSLKATKLVAKIRKIFKVQISIRDIMGYKSIENISKLINIRPKENKETSEIAIAVAEEDI